jgi:hypothetical protein
MQKAMSIGNQAIISVGNRMFSRILGNIGTQNVIKDR